MSWLEFFSATLASAAWPVALVWATYLLKGEIKAITTGLQLTKLKGGPFEAEFSQSVERAKEIFSESASVEEKPEARGHTIDATNGISSSPSSSIIINLHPEYAVLDAWKQLEHDLEEFSRGATTDGSSTRRQSARKKILDLSAQKIISPEQAEGLLELYNARNAIVHSKGYQMSESEMSEYLSIANSARISLHRELAKAKAKKDQTVQDNPRE